MACKLIDGTLWCTILLWEKVGTERSESETEVLEILDREDRL